MDKISEEIKLKRLRKLQNQIKIYADEYNNNLLDKTQKVLVEGFSKKNINQLMGRTNCNRVVNFSGKKNIIGKLVNLKITQVLSNSLKGELI